MPVAKATIKEIVRVLNQLESLSGWGALSSGVQQAIRDAIARALLERVDIRDSDGDL